MDTTIDVFKNLTHHGLDILITIFIAILVFIIGSNILSSIVSHVVRARGRKWAHQDIKKRQATLSGLFVTLWRITVSVIGVLIVFREVFPDVSLAPIFASAGIVGVAVGFGSQSLVKDFLTGIFIVSENQYRVGDFVDIGGASGTVERIGTRSTVLRDPDGNVHFFPNGMIQHVINKTMDFGKARFAITVAPEADLSKVIDLINKTGKKLAEEESWQKHIIDPPRFVSVEDFTTTTVVIIVAGKTPPADQWMVAAEMKQRLLTAFQKAEIPLSPTMPPAPSVTKK